MDALKAIYHRRSIRSYQERNVEPELITTLLQAATAAPTAVNCQPWEFIVVDDDDKIKTLKEECIFARYNAKNTIIVCGNMKLALKGQDHEMWVQDCSAATENILIAATSLGLGTVWIGLYPVKNRVDLFRKLFNIPDHVVPMCMVYVGYPAEQKEARHRLDEKRVYYQEYEPKRKHRLKDKPVIGHY